MIAFLCSGCGKSLKVKDELAGRKGKCPHCQQSMTVPSVADAARERAEQAGHDNYSESDAKTILPPNLDAALDPKTILPAVPRGKSGMKKGNTLIPDAPTTAPAGNGDAELYDFLSSAQEADEIGRLGSYRVLKVLGAGGMGVVFQAEDPKLKRLVALKAMLPALAASGTNKERFLREARAAAAIEHDHIIPIFQVDEDRGVPFIAMPFLRGESLEDRLKRQRKLPIEEALRIAKETAEGLGAAHERNMIHRDIKPANIWLEGEKGRVKILDFGLARSASGESNLTQQGAIIGTPAYMAPEQGAGKPVDTRCDLFSLGCVLYRMVTGTLPFKGADTVSTLVAVATETPTAPRKLNPAVSPRLSKLIMELLAKDPKDRPPSALSVVDLIEELEKEPPTDTTEMLDERSSRVQIVREDDDLDHDTVRSRTLNENDLEELPAKRSLMMPLLIGGGVGCFGLMVIAIIALVVVFKKGDKAEVAQNNNSTVQNNANAAQPVNQNPSQNQNLNPQQGNVLPGGNANLGGNNEGVKDPPNGKGNGANGFDNQPERRPKREGEQEADKTFQPYSSDVRGLLFAPDGKGFFSFAERESRVDYWDLATRKSIRTFTLAGAVRGIVLSTDGSQLMAYNDNQLIVWDTDGGGTPQHVTPLLGQKIIGGGFTGEKHFRVALAVKQEVGRGFPPPIVGGVQIYDKAVNNLLMVAKPALKKKPIPITLAPHNGEVLRAFFSPDGNKVLTWCKDHTFRTWDLEGKRQLATFPVSPGEAKSISVSSDFQKILASFGRAGVRVYDVGAGTEVKEFKPEGIGDTDAAAFGTESNMVGVTATFGGPTCVYDLENTTIKKKVKGIAFSRSVALTSDGKTLLCGDMGGNIHIFKLDGD
ncbi:MAG TPA: serine/threonine-protein kinase [Gemmataceae bacterium]|nr:serine/threonine-protein kinase [Gemmataceae bacterium]